MPLVDIGPTHWPTQPQPTVSLGNLTADAADEVAGFVFQAPRAGNVTRLHFRTGTVTTGATVDVRLETVADGLPTGTLFGANTNVAHVIADTDDNVWHRTAPLTAAAAVTHGQLLAVVIVNPTVSAGNFSISSGSAASIATGGAPYCISPTRAGKINQGPLCGLEYDDGVILGPVAVFPVFTVSTNLALNTGTNPDEVAAYLTVPFACRVLGWFGTMTVAAGADFRVNLYADGNNTPLLSQDYDGDVTATGSVGGAERLFSSTLVLAPGTYRLALAPLTANSVTARYIEVAAAHPTILDGISGRSGVHYSSRNRSGITDPDAAAWAEIVNRRLQMGLIIDQIDDGTGAGGGVNRAALPSGVSALG